jgi:molybdopterin molybdotransferase
MEQVFSRLGGSLVYNSLKVRPGKSTLFGMLDRIPFFGLPGPPPAVRILFHELIAPALNRLQGLAAGNQLLPDALLTEPVSLKQTGHLYLKGAVAAIVAGQLQVRPARRLEPINAIIHFQEDQQTVQTGDLVKIRCIAQLDSCL